MELYICTASLLYNFIELILLFVNYFLDLYFIHTEVFTPALDSGHSLESAWQ